MSFMSCCTYGVELHVVVTLQKSCKLVRQIRLACDHGLLDWQMWSVLHVAILHKSGGAQDDERFATVHPEFKVQQVTAKQGLQCMCCLDANRRANAAP